MRSWDVAQWLESLSYAVVVLGAIAGAVIFLVRWRAAAIDSKRRSIVRSWTNEGDIHSTDKIFITLELKDVDGDLIGSIVTSTQDRPLEAHASIGCFRSKVDVSLLLGRNLLPIGTATLVLAGNGNRLKWRFSKKSDEAELPEKTVLWPSISHPV